MIQALMGLIARICISAVFLFSGWGKLLNPHQTIEHFHKVGIPLAKAAYGAAVGIEILCGVLLLLGARTRVASLLLAILVIISTYYFYFDFSDRMQIVAMLKNLAIVGGLLHLSAYGSGGFSLDRK
ncbi:MAG TPA: DoxX family protein [Bdellovibrionota bacterium]|nr:DoxX family protein [Bdellovibrionota bacterium]